MGIIAFIGHGRSLELFLGFYKIVLSIFISMSTVGTRVPALSDFSWVYPRYVIAAPFAIIGTAQLLGLLLNMRGVEQSWVLRFVGAGAAMLVWMMLLVKSSWLGEPTLMIPMALSALPASAFLMFKAWNRLPVPGA